MFSTLPRPTFGLRWHSLCAALLLTLVTGPSLAAEALLFEQVRILGGDGSVLEDASLLLVDGVISAVGVSADMSLPANVERINLRGKTLMPALIDAHAHLGFEGSADWGAQNYTRENLLDHLNRYAWYGFSAVFSAGSDPAPLAQSIQRQQAAGELGGARLLFAAGMAPPGQGPNNQFLEQALLVEQALDMQILFGLAEPQQARESVRELARRNIGFIKLWVDDRGGTQEKLSPALYRAVAAEANSLGIPVLVHQQAAADMPDLIDAGVRGFLHGRLENGFTPEIAQAASERGVFIVPNLGLAALRREAIGVDPFLAATLSPLALSRLQVSPQRALEPPINAVQELALERSVAALLAAGTEVVLGTDAGALPDHPFGYTGHRELEIFVRLGMTPMQAIVAGTSAAARALGLLDSGEIRAGFRGDLLILDADPRDDIRNTREIYQVYLGGELLDRESLQATFMNGAGQ